MSVWGLLLATGSQLGPRGHSEIKDGGLIEVNGFMNWMEKHVVFITISTQCYELLLGVFFSKFLMETEVEITQDVFGFIVLFDALLITG